MEARDEGFLLAEPCVMARPYIALSIAQLEVLAAEDSTDRDSVECLVEELRHRKGRRVRNLLSQLVSESAGIAEDPSPEQDSDGRVVKSPKPDSLDCDVRAYSLDPGSQTSESYELLLRKYETLRATFTAEAELLARWGMTPLMPSYMQELVFEEWRKRISLASDPIGRSLDSLAADQRRITDERRLLREAQGRRPKRHSAGESSEC